MDRDSEDGPGPERLPRRELLKATSAGVLAASVAGCNTTERRRYEADPALLSREGRSMGYDRDGRDSITTEFTEEAGGIELKVTLVSHLAVYEGDEEDVGLVSTPSAAEAGQQLNPMADEPLQQLLEERGQTLLRAVRDEGGSTEWRRGPEAMASFDVELLGQPATGKTFVGTTTDDDAVMVHVVRVTHEGDVVFVGGGESSAIEESGRPLVGDEGYYAEGTLVESRDTYREVLPHVEHPAGQEATTARQDLGDSIFDELTVESVGAGYTRTTGTVEIPVEGGELVEKTVALDDPKLTRELNERAPGIDATGSLTDGSDEGLDLDPDDGVTLVGDVPDRVATLATAPIETVLEDAAPPPRASLKSDQTPLRSQGGRRTCVVFCCLAAMEARLKRKQFEVDFSEQYAQHLMKTVTLNMRKGDSNQVDSCFDGKRSGPLDLDGFENAVALGGGGAIGWELQFLREYGIPQEEDAKFQVDASKDRTYVTDGDYGEYNNDDSDPHVKWCNPKSATQRAVNDFNVEHDVIEVPISKSRTLRMRPFPRKALKNAYWKVGSFMHVSGGEKLKNPTWFETMIGEESQEVLVTFPTGACTGRYKPIPKKDDFEDDAEFKKALRDWESDNGDVFTYDGDKDCSGLHCMLLVEYDRTADPPHFVAKNSWGTYTKLGHDYIEKGGLREAGVVTSVVSEPSNFLKEPDFLGRWDLVHDGKEATLDIYRKPGYYDDPSKLGGAADERIGTLFDVEGTGYSGYRVNGAFDVGRNEITFSFDPEKPRLDYDEQGETTFQGYMSVSDRDFIAGSYSPARAGVGRRGFYATPNTKTTRDPVVQYSTRSPESFLGEWVVRSAEYEGSVDVESVTGAPNFEFSGTLRGSLGGVTVGPDDNGSISGTANPNTLELSFEFPVNHADLGRVRLEGHLHEDSLGKISGRLQTDQGRRPVLLTRVGTASATVKIIEPQEGSTVAGPGVDCEAWVEGVSDPGRALIWTLDGPYDRRDDDAGKIFGYGTEASTGVSDGEHTITATYTGVDPWVTDSVTITVN